YFDKLPFGSFIKIDDVANTEFKTRDPIDIPEGCTLPDGYKQCMEDYPEPDDEYYWKGICYEGLQLKEILNEWITFKAVELRPTEHAKQGLLEAEMFVKINFLRKEDIGVTMNKQMIAYPPLRARRHKLRISKGGDFV
ncbi:unnamed protein product, partial [Porites evermanni]